MKKILSLILILSLSLALAACGGVSTSAPSAPVPAEASPEEPASQEAAETAAESLSEESAGPDEAAVAVFTVYHKEGDYNDSIGNDYHYSFRIPAFAGESGDILRLNTETYDFYMSLIRRDLECIEENAGYSLLAYNADYECHVNGSLVSLLCQVSNDWGQPRYRAVNIDAEGHELSRAEVLEAAGLDEEGFLTLAAEALKASFSDPEKLPEEARPYAEEQNAKTLAEDNLLDTQLFLNGEGKLSMVVRVFVLAGPDYIWRVIDL